MNFLKRIILKKVELIDIEGISSVFWEKAIQLTAKIDQFDAPFIALSLELEAPLWTGDKKLKQALEKKNVDWILTTDTIQTIRNDIEGK